LSRRVSLPNADDLFRPTVVPDPTEPESEDDTAGSIAEDPAASAGPTTVSGKAPSGRVKHDEKMTVYITSEELLDLEQARLQLRRSHGLAVDRGRLVRTAVAMALADLDEHGDDSLLVRRLRA
jgi:hypothetical protein